jgi:hypothetical protein
MPVKGFTNPTIRDVSGNLIPWKKRNKDRANAKERERRKARTKRDPLQERLSRRKWFVKMKFGITLEQRNAMIISQNYRCAICDTSIPDINDSNWAIDHNHCTDEVRAMLCKACNSALGLLKESASILNKAIQYLEKFNVRTETQC